MPTLRLGAAQLHYHPAFEGGGKQALREPTGVWEGAGLSALRAGTEEGDRLLRQLRERIEKAYVAAYWPRLEAVVRFAAGLELDLLVLPEYAVTLALLPAVAEAAGERMTVIAGTHTVTPEGARKSGIYEVVERFAKDGEEVIYGHGRPVVYANRAREGGTRIFVAEAGSERGAAILAAGAPPELPAGVEGVVMAEVRFGKARERYRPVVSSRPLGAAVVLDARALSALRAAEEAVLEAGDADEAFAQVEAAERVFREAAGDARLPAIARERWACLGGGAEGITTVEHLHALARDVWVEGVASHGEIERALVEGAVRVLREVEKKAPDAQKVVTVRGWLEGEVLKRFEGVEAAGEVVEAVTEGVLPELERAPRRETRALVRNETSLRALTAIVKPDERERFVEPLARTRGEAETPTPVFEQLDAWLNGSLSLGILLGEFGIGKSTVSKHFAARLAQAALDGDGRPVIFVDLRACSGPAALAGLVRRALGVDNLAPYRSVVEEGECILILDGFDEMSIDFTWVQLADTLRALLAWRTDRSKILLTCRTHLFINPADINRVLTETVGAPLKTPGLGDIEGATVLELQRFDKERILAYLARVTPDPERAWEAMGRVSDLCNLAEQPMLLDLIRQHLPALMRAEKVSLAELYESYIQKWVEWPGSDEWLDPAEKIAIAEDLAFCIWNGAVDAISFVEISKIFFRGKSTDGILRFDDQAMRLELWAGTFLVWQEGGEGGYYSFAHHSFLEYVLARRAVQKLGDGDRGALDVPPFSPQVIAYCKARPGWEAARQEAAALLVEPYRRSVSENALLLVAGEEGIGSSAERPWRLEGAVLWEMGLRGARLAGARLAGARLAWADLTGADLHGAQLEEAVLDRADLARADLREAVMKGATARGAILAGTRFEGADLRTVRFDESSAFVEAPVLRGARLEGACITGTAWREPAHCVEMCGLEGAEEARWRRDDPIEHVGEGREASRVEPLWHRDCVNDVALSPNGRKVAAVCNDRVVRIWEAGTGRLLQTLHEHTDGVTSVAWTADGKRLATGLWGKTARVWEVRTGRLLQTFQEHADWITSVAWAADGERLATGSWDKTARVWEARTGRLLQTIHGHTDSVLSVAWAVDGERLATGSMDKTARVWEVRTGRLLQTLQEHTGSVLSVAWAADGERMATGSGDSTARVWEARTGSPLQTFHGHADRVTSVAWAADGERLATGSDDKTARVWEARTGRLLRTLQGHAEAVWSVAWTPDGKGLVTGADAVRLWDVETARELASFLHTPTGGVAIAGPHVVTTGEVDLSALVVRTGTACAPLALYKDLCLRPDLVAASLAGNPVAPLHIPMDTAVRAVAVAAHDALVPHTLGTFPPLKAGDPIMLPAPWSISNELLRLPGFRLTLKAILPSGSLDLPRSDSPTTLSLPALPPGTHQLLLTLHLGDRHERSFTFPLNVFAQNPYIAGPPVRGAEFIGRDADLARIRSFLQHGSLRLVGERRIGKTSILHHFLDHPGAHASVWLNAEEKLDTPFREWVTSTIRHHLDGAPASPADLIPFLRRLAASGRRPLLLFDEVVHLRGLSISDAGWLRSLSSPPIDAILAGSPFDWHRFFESLPNEAGSPFNHLQDAVIGPLTEVEMKRLVARPGAAPPDEPAMRRILELSAGRPYLAQRLCQAALALVHREERMAITQADVEAIEREALVKGMDHQHRKRWAELASSEEARQAVLAYARTGADAPRGLSDMLQEQGLFDGKAWSIDPAFVMWVREREEP